MSMRTPKQNQYGEGSDKNFQLVYSLISKNKRKSLQDQPPTVT